MRLRSVYNGGGTYKKRLIPEINRLEDRTRDAIRKWIAFATEHHIRVTDVEQVCMSYVEMEFDEAHIMQVSEQRKAK